MNRILLLLVALPFGFCAEQRSCLGQEEGQPAGNRATDDDKADEARPETTQRLDRMRRFAEAATFQVDGEGEQPPAKAVNAPILRFDDNARANDDGTVWVWGRVGRPVAVSEIFSYPGRRALTHTGHSLSTVPLKCQLGGTPVIESRKPGISLQPFPGVTVPTANKTARLRQIKQLSRRFAAHEFWKPGNTRYELRMLPQPLYRYADSDSGIVDGAIFAFCHGTNPEVIMLIELAGDTADNAKWQFACARLAHAECHVTLDGEDVWNCRRYENIVPAGEPYWTFMRGFDSLDPAASPQSRLRSVLDRLFNK